MFNTNFNINSLLAGGGAFPQYKSKVLADGGSITNEDYLKARILHAQDNNYFENIAVWYATEFGVKIDSGYVQKIYDVIDTENNSVVQLVGSEQPAWNASAQNSKSAVISDGVDDSLQTTHGNVIMPAGEFTLVLVVKPLAHTGGTTRFLVAGRKDKASPLGVLEAGASPLYKSSNTKVNGTANTFVINPTTTGMPLNNWYVVALNCNVGGTWRLNDLIGQKYTTLESATDMEGVTLFGNQRTTNPTDYLTRSEIAEYMVIRNGVSMSVLNSLMEQINTHYDIYTPVTLLDYATEEMSSTDGAFSLRKIVPDYLGSCVRLRRSSDDAEMDFGFVDDLVDLASIATWAGADDLFLRTFYDQDGGADFQQATGTQQMQFFSTGGGITTNLPYLKGSLANKTNMTRATALTAINTWRVYVAFSDSSNANATLWVGGTSSVMFGAAAKTSGGNIQFFKRTGGVSYFKATANYNNGNSPIIIATFENLGNTPSSDDLNCDFQTQNEAGSVAVNTYPTKGANNTVTLGSNFYDLAFDGKIFEIIFTNDLTHNKRNVQHNLINRYQNHN